MEKTDDGDRITDAGFQIPDAGYRILYARSGIAYLASDFFNHEFDHLKQWDINQIVPER